MKSTFSRDQFDAGGDARQSSKERRRRLSVNATSTTPCSSTATPDTDYQPQAMWRSRNGTREHAFHRMGDIDQGVRPAHGERMVDHAGHQRAFDARPVKRPTPAVQQGAGR